jgi:hypothetical protein
MNSAEQICKEIKDAFGSVKLDGGLTISQFEVEHQLSESEMITTRNNDPESDWIDIPDSKLEESYEVLFARDFRTWVFHLAAYLHWAARNSCKTMSPALDALVTSLTRRTGRMDYFDQLNIYQKHAIRSLLEYLDGNGSDTDAFEAISSYWRESQEP